MGCAVDIVWYSQWSTRAGNGGTLGQSEGKAGGYARPRKGCFPVEKPIPGGEALVDVIRRRWSPRAFVPKAIAPDVLRRIFEASRWAPSAYNEQPWRFLVARREDEKTFGTLLGCLVGANQVWARHAAVLAVGVVKRVLAFNGKLNLWAEHDLGAAVAQLSLQAVAEGLFVHPMAGFSPSQVREACGVPEGYDPLVALALGYGGDPDDLPEELRPRERGLRERQALEEMVFGAHWKAEAPFAG